jgi:hypothetical protein
MKEGFQRRAVTCTALITSSSAVLAGWPPSLGLVDDAFPSMFGPSTGCRSSPHLPAVFVR